MVIKIYKSCSKCGKIHDTTYNCKVGRVYTGGQERKLRSKYKWYKKSKQVREQSKHLCAVCFDEGIYTYDHLEVHHIIKLRQDKTKLLDDENLICLCVKHHKLADEGKLDKEYLLKLAQKRINEG